MHKKHKWIKVIWKKKEVGKLRDDGRVFQTIRTPAHIYKKLNSFGFSRDMLNHIYQYSNYRLQQVRIVYIDKEKREAKLYKIAYHKIKELGILENISNDIQYHIKLEVLKKINE